MSWRHLGEYAGALLVAALVVSAAGVASGGGGGGNATPPADTSAIRSCTVITDPGRYTLVNDIGQQEADKPCLVVDSDGVTLDGRNYSVVGRDASTAAVRITGVNVTVRDVFVTGGVEYSTGEGSTSRVSVSGGKLFVDAQRRTTGDRTVVEKTVRVSDRSGVSSSSSSRIGSSSVSVSGSSSSSSSTPSVTPPSLDPSASKVSISNSSSEAADELPLDGGAFPSVCGFGRIDGRAK